MTIPEQLRELLAKATPGDWQIKSEYHPERDERCTIIANVDCEIIEGHSYYSYDFVARTLDEFCEGGPEAEADAALLVFLRKHAPHFATLEEENVRLREALVTAMIPIEAILLSGSEGAHCKEVQDALHDAKNEALAALQEQPK